ncbi:EamA family transporter [Aequorivita vladivostokensis]|uniref:Multidrug transporter n=1 Tax=Aequorivita vladivostokensis TaxID=171194 RepID=A0ABR5DH65_9FLAO|nr:EamA family transporter [Aequorivita vladivostokensis]MAB57622.1 EamA family transporter [Aequorivita sp.]KJJ38118.1 multidrug transporter [Aequorivita vladivostokensis]MAO49170.1 EamA family transporter [Aequorivita sp.]MBF30340.1 EamA family transporter [Aequorivita sp.]MDX1782992.1 EamA family transporter [Aequorivita vladivostokensis]
MKPETRNPVLIILAFFSIYVIWGSTYMLNKVAVAELPPFFLASIRFTSAGLLIFIIAKIMGKSLAITRKQFINAFIVGVLFLSFGNGIIVWALKYVDSGFAALEISAQPLVVLLLMWLLQGKRIKPMSLVGVGLGIIGIFLLVVQKQLIAQEGTVLGMVMIFACMLSWAYGSLFVGKADLPKNFFVNTGYQMFTAGITLAVASFLFGEEWIAPKQWEAPVQWSMVLLIIFGSIVAFTSFNYLLKTVSPDKVATSTYVNPIIALILGWYVLNEEITTQSIVAAAVLLTGVYFINTSKTTLTLPRFSGKIRK